MQISTTSLRDLGVILSGLASAIPSKIGLPFTVDLSVLRVSISVAVSVESSPKLPTGGTFPHPIAWPVHSSFGPRPDCSSTVPIPSLICIPSNVVKYPTSLSPSPASTKTPSTTCSTFGWVAAKCSALLSQINLRWWLLLNLQQKWMMNKMPHTKNTFENNFRK